MRLTGLTCKVPWKAFSGPRPSCQGPLLTSQHALHRSCLSFKIQQNQGKWSSVKVTANWSGVGETPKLLHQVRQVGRSETPSDPVEGLRQLHVCHRALFCLLSWSVAKGHSCLPHMTWPFPPTWTVQSTPSDCNSEGPQVVITKQEVMTDLKNPNCDEGKKQQNMSSEICLLLGQMHPNRTSPRRVTPNNPRSCTAKVGLSSKMLGTPDTELDKTSVHCSPTPNKAL